jgi:hypothetical protein
MFFLLVRGCKNELFTTQYKPKNRTCIIHGSHNFFNGHAITRYYIEKGEFWESGSI